MKFAAKTIMTLSVIGCINAAYLTYLFVQASLNPNIAPFFCDINATLSCSNVILSPYSQIFGVPICTIALTIYPVLFFLALRVLKSKSPKDIFFALGILSAMGLMMNLLYVYNEFAYIGAYCIMCMICGVLIMTNLIMSIVGYIQAPIRVK